MNSGTRFIVLASALTAAALGGCCRGTKVTFVNLTDKAFLAEFVTQGGPEREARRDLGRIEPGKEATTCKKWRKDMLPADFNIAIDGGLAGETHKSVRIQKDYPKRILVEVMPDADLGRRIEVRDQDGKIIPRR